MLAEAAHPWVAAKVAASMPNAPTAARMAHAASVSGPASSLFVVGNPAHNEFESTPPNEGAVDGDVLRLDRTHDSLDDLSAKVLDAIRWAVVHWRFDYLFKADDDTY
ncbi:hypothetical protein EMIHUDRAFT_259908, partial [Emiliania huxleyi CCMP1516]|uniref:Hexosyltransferase n=2 Tax=Emiliania huxleyi TaxID=2903 RepID=A0A0D3KZA6_EMIH1